jgi:hypothetical protein
MEMESAICDKHNIKLTSIKEGETTSFKLRFEVKNSAYNLHNAIGFKLFHLLGELNKDIVDETYMEPYDETSSIINTGIIFKQIGKDFGITQKYIFSKIERTSIDDNCFRFVLSQIDKPISVTVPKKSESAVKSSSILDIKMNSLHHATFTYCFSIEFDEDTPIYMDNMPGMLMKKIFYRLKNFLDNIS